MLERMWRKGNPSTLFVGMQTGAATEENSMEFPQKTKAGTDFHNSNPTGGTIPESPIQKNLCTPMFIAALFTIAKCWKQPKCPSVHEQIKKLWHIYTMEYYAAERKKELLPFGTAWMEVESIMLGEISQVVKDKYHMISPVNGT